MKKTYIIKYNDYGIVIAIADDFAGAQAMFNTRFNDDLENYEIKSISHFEETKEPIV